MKKINDTRLSYSSAKLLQSCSMKYNFYKVANTPKDPDASQNEDAFNIGKAFHQVLENTNHVYNDATLEKELVASCKMYDVEEHQAMINAMLLKYHKLHIRSGLRAIVNEIQLDNDIFLGYVDSIMRDDVTGKWWVVDLKTAASIYDKTYITLERDVQLSLYASFAEEIAKDAREMGEDLDMENFGGVRYRVTSKPKIKRKKNESYGEYVLRIANAASCRSLDIVIPKERLRPKETYEEHKKLHQLSLDIRSGKVKPVCNYANCFSYFRPCDWFSKCHGGTATEVNNRLEIIE